MLRKVPVLLCFFPIIFLFIFCGQQSSKETEELRNKISQLEHKVKQLQSEKDNLRDTIDRGSKTSGEVGVSSGSGYIQNKGQTSPSYYYGEMLTKNGNRIRVTQFGKQAGDEYSRYKVKGVYKDQKVEIEWKDLKRIWVTGPLICYHGGPLFPDTVDLEMADGRHFKIQYKELEPCGSIPYITVNEITGERSLQYIGLSNLIVIAINGKLESLNYCANCKKYFPDIYKYCPKCGRELHYQNVPE